MAKHSLTAAAVERIKPPVAGQLEIFDRGYPSLALRVSYGGSRAWVFFYRLNGKQHRLTLGAYPFMSLAEARAAWREARSDVQNGIEPSKKRRVQRPATSFDAVLEEWLLRDQAKNRSLPMVRGMMVNNVLPHWTGRDVASIGRRDVLDVVDSIVDRGTVVSARRTQAYIHRLFRWAISRGIVESNPAANLEKPGSEKPRERVLSDSELVAVWRGAEKQGYPYGPIAQLLILTAARRGEIGALRWDEIVGNTIELSGERTKGGRSHTIPLSTAAMALIEALPRIASSDFVFGRRPPGSWSQTKPELDKLSGVTGWHLHDLRRTAATGMQRLGVNLQTIEAVLGHVAGSRAGIVSVYQRHSFSDEKRAALEAWGAYVMALVGGA
jgi:integrase